jgi:peroxiredoxin
MGTRSQRYSMLIDDCVVKSLNMESNPGEAKASGAETMMGQL